MPTSSSEGKPWAVDRIVTAQPGHIVDVGAGDGGWVDRLRPLVPGARFTAVEIWGPYVEQHRLRDRYEHVIIADARWLDWRRLTADVIILGDVLEHMPLVDAAALWRRLTDAAPHALASLPIVDWPQGPVDGNPHEAHLDTWSHELALATLTGVTDHWAGEQVGAYWR